MMKLLSLFLIAGSALLAQDPNSAIPPTYDYDLITPGTQGPMSPLVAGYTYRSVRSYQLAVPVIVPLSDLQRVLPAGFTAIASPAGSNTTTVTLTLFLDQRFQPNVAAPIVYGPTSALLVTATALNSNVSPARNEIVFPCFEASADVAQLNAVFGAGTARLAEVSASVSEEEGKLKFEFEISDKSIGMDLKVSAASPTTLNTQTISDPVGLPFRALTGLVGTNPAFHAASQSNTLALAATAADLKVDTPGHRLSFPAGTLSILGYGPNVTFSRGVEFIIKFE